MRVWTGNEMSINGGIDGGKREPVPTLCVCPCSITRLLEDCHPARWQFLAGVHARQNPHTAYLNPEKTLMTGYRPTSRTGYRPAYAVSPRSGSG